MVLVGLAQLDIWDRKEETMETKKELRQQLTESVIREANHYVALDQIQKVITQSEITREPFAFTIEKIKKVLATRFQANS